ncbi:hypothetical protein [Nocardia sp. 348MFTsu5.1]|uniref:hypothetical protein n=1 Tax=Nocardia sp. 348MFTsu5.1 TaxID=1172185 RepID=UPI0012DC7FCA|nr:hypothetical protein [Nocardia sp. 348MFTsu5.1]
MRKIMNRFTVAVVAALGVISGSVITTSNASAAQVYLSPMFRDRVVIIELTHSETVAAAQIGAGNVINAVLGNNRWGVLLEDGSKYRGPDDLPVLARSWNTVTGQQVIAEAASHPSGRVVFGVFPDNPTLPLWVMQDW